MKKTAHFEPSFNSLIRCVNSDYFIVLSVSQSFWGVFIMKLTYKDKVQIYELRKQGQTFKQLSKRFGVDVSALKYMVKLIDSYGIEIVKKGKNRYYSPELKQEIIDKVLLEGLSRKRVSLDYALPKIGKIVYAI